MGRVQDNVAKAFPKLADANRQNLAVSMFRHGLPDQEVARMTAIQGRAMWRRPYVLLIRRRHLVKSNATPNARNRVGVGILRMLLWMTINKAMLMKR